MAMPLQLAWYTSGVAPPNSDLQVQRRGAPAQDVVRGELVDAAGGGQTFVAVRKLRWGAEILKEKPLVLVEPDSDSYLEAADADPRLKELAEALGDKRRLAMFIAFKQLHDRKQREVLELWHDGLEESDAVAKAALQTTMAGVEAFTTDRPEFGSLLPWSLFSKVVAIFARFGLQNPDGSVGIYGLCSRIRHSCAPTAAWFTLQGAPKARRMLHVIDIDGIEKGQEITVSLVPERILLLPRAERSLNLYKGVANCSCRKCSQGPADDNVGAKAAFASLQAALAVRPPSSSSMSRAQDALKLLDKLLPFSMQLKAKAKVFLAQSLQELLGRAAWEEEHREANIVRCDGFVVSAQEQRLKEVKRLYETSAKDFELLLGAEAAPILARLEQSLAPLSDQQKLIRRLANKQASAEEAPKPPSHTVAEDDVPSTLARPPLTSTQKSAGDVTAAIIKGHTGMPEAWRALLAGKNVNTPSATEEMEEY